MVMFLVARVEFFQSRFFLKYFFFLFWQKVFLGLVKLEQSVVKVFLLAGLDFLGLESSSLDFLVLNP